MPTHTVQLAPTLGSDQLLSADGIVPCVCVSQELAQARIEYVELLGGDPTIKGAWADQSITSTLSTLTTLHHPSHPPPSTTLSTLPPSTPPLRAQTSPATPYRNEKRRCW